MASTDSELTDPRAYRHLAEVIRRQITSGDTAAWPTDAVHH